MAIQRSSAYNSDLPIQGSAEDRYEFAPFANHVIDELFSDQQPESIVVGLSGAWGSGKTSLLNLMVERVEHLKSKEKRVINIRYVPWRAKNRDALITSFLTLLVEKIEEEMERVPDLKDKITSGLGPVKEYAKSLKQLESGLKPFVTVLSALGVPFIDKIFDTMADVRSSLAEETSLDLEELHQNAYAALKELQIPTLVMIDDLDRLEPSEIIDMLRLVRSTAQLPYVTFIMCYDHTNVIEAIETVLKVDGRKFLGKLVQLPIYVPSIPDKVLLRVALMDLERLTAAPKIDNIDLLAESSAAFENVSKLQVIQTPRDIHRITNSFIFRVRRNLDFSTTLTMYLAVIEAMDSSTYKSIDNIILQNVNEDSNRYLLKSSIGELRSLHLSLSSSESRDNEPIREVLNLVIANIESEESK